MPSTGDGARPAVAPDAWIAPGAVLIGDVAIGRRSSIWFGAVVRADQDRIVVGDDTNIQDGSIMHADPGIPLTVGDRVWSAMARFCTDARSATTY